MENSESARVRNPTYWMRNALRFKDAYAMHIVSGQLAKDPITRKRSWGNVTEHCLVQMPRVRILGEWIGLEEDLVAAMECAVLVHDFDKKNEILEARKASLEGRPQLPVVKEQGLLGDARLESCGFSPLVVRLASSPGGLSSELFESWRLIEKTELLQEDWAYLICHLVDDYSVGSDWVRPSLADKSGKTVKNIVDYRAEENVAKPAYKKISEEVAVELIGSKFEGINNHHAMAIVSHKIEQRLAERIAERTGEAIDPLKLAELVDRKIAESLK